MVGLYLNPPEHAVVLSVDEKTQIQALERTQVPRPALAPSRPEFGGAPIGVITLRVGRMPRGASF